MGARHQIGPEQLRQGARVEFVGLDLGLGNQARLVRMRQHHLSHFLDLLELLVEPAPVPAGFDHDLARPTQRPEELNKARGRIADNAGFADALAVLVERTRERVALVIIYRGKVHRVTSWVNGST